MSCYRHNNVSARFECGGCRGQWCVDCVVRPEDQNMSLCPKCHSVMRAIPPTRVLQPEERYGITIQEPDEEITGTFFASLGSAFLFPFRPKVFISMLLVTAGFSLLPFAPVYGLRSISIAFIIQTCLLGLISNYLGDVIYSIAVGDEELPRLQWFENFIIDGMIAGGRTVLLFMLGFGIWPYLAYNRHPELGLKIALISAFFFPIMWLGAALNRSLVGALHPIMFRLLGRLIVPYSAAYGMMLAGLIGCYSIMTIVAEHSEGMAILAVFPLGSYILYVISYMLGKLVYYNQELFEEAGVF